MIMFLSITLALATPFILIGAFVVYQVVKKQEIPADESNRLGHIALIWEACTAPNRFAECRQYLKYDVSDWAEIIKKYKEGDS